MSDDKILERLNQERITTRLQKQEIEKLEARNTKLQKKLNDLKRQSIKREQEIQEEEEEIQEREAQVKEEYACIKASLNGSMTDKIQENTLLNEELKSIRAEKIELEEQNKYLEEYKTSLDKKINELQNLIRTKNEDQIRAKNEEIRNLHLALRVEKARSTGYLYKIANLEAEMKRNVALLEATKKLVPATNTNNQNNSSSPLSGEAIRFVANYPEFIKFVTDLYNSPVGDTYRALMSNKNKNAMKRPLDDTSAATPLKSKQKVAAKKSFQKVVENNANSPVASVKASSSTNSPTAGAGASSSRSSPATSVGTSSSKNSPVASGRNSPVENGSNSSVELGRKAPIGINKNPSLEKNKSFSIQNSKKLPNESSNNSAIGNSINSSIEIIDESNSQDENMNTQDLPEIKINLGLKKKFASPELGDSPNSSVDLNDETNNAVVFDVKLSPMKPPVEQTNKPIVYLDTMESTLSSTNQSKSNSPDREIKQEYDDDFQYTLSFKNENEPPLQEEISTKAKQTKQVAFADTTNVETLKTKPVMKLNMKPLTVNNNKNDTTCTGCEKFYETGPLPDVEHKGHQLTSADRIKLHSRHRARATTPPEFWDLGFPYTLSP